MPLIRVHAEYVTMINYFKVNPRDQADLMRVQEEDLSLFGRKQPAMRAASFHRSIDGDRVINYAHWSDLSGLAAWRQSADFKAHMDRMAGFEFTVDPHPYQIVGLSKGIEAPRIAPHNDLFPTLIMAEVEAGAQADLAQVLTGEISALSPDAASGHHASWLAQSRDGVRLAIYSQWKSAPARQRFIEAGGGRLGAALAGAIKYEVKGFEVGAVGYKFEDDAVGSQPGTRT
jgi:heme-degrading monooxygenase HmoA